MARRSRIQDNPLAGLDGAGPASASAIAATGAPTAGPETETSSAPPPAPTAGQQGADPQLDPGKLADDDEAQARRTLQASVGRALAGKYMTFKLSLEEYGIEILKVRELIRLMHITQVPGTSEFVRGVINLRGKIIPVIDLKRKFGMGSLEETDQTVVIVVQYVSQDRLTTMGILVDEVLEVVSIAADQIEPPPDFGVGCVDVEFILGVGKADRRVILMLDIGKVLTAEETRRLGQTAAS